MYNFVSFSVKCPVCGVSLMDPEHTVDNSPGIKLNIRSYENRGNIYLSSIYGSYNYICDFTPARDEQAEFSCPACKSVLISEKKCSICKAPMVPLYLDIGGVVEFCSRAGCKNHFVEFDDLAQALNKFYQDYHYPDLFGDKFRSDNVISKTAEDKSVPEIIESGSFLHAYCPFCNRSLIESNTIKLKVLNNTGEEGFLILSPYLNVFSSKSTIFLNENKVVKDIKCTHCGESLIKQGKSCETCGSPVALVSVGARTKLIDFYICSKKGCRWHGLSDEDVNEIKLEDSLEW